MQHGNGQVPQHINVLELASALQAVKRIAARGGGRAILLLDSNVALQTIAKGRSSAESLASLLRKICSLCLAFGVSLSVHFCPTRLSVSDDPSRSVCLRPARAGGSCLSWTLMDFSALPSFQNSDVGFPIGLAFSLDFASTFPSSRVLGSEQSPQRLL